MKRELIEYIERHNLIKPGETIIIGLSGGPDSVALFYMLKSIKEEYNICLKIAHLNHLLRGDDSAQDEQFVRNLGAKHNIETFIESVDIKRVANDNKIGIEEAGRDNRYHFFEKVKKYFGADKVALAHNSDDNIETFLFRMIRGTSIKGLCAIPVKRDFYIRPILFLTKKRIIDYLKENSLSYQIDKTNFETDYTRNKIRLNLIPTIENDFNSNLKSHITNLIQDFNGILDLLEKRNYNIVEKEKIPVKILDNINEFEKGYLINEFLNGKGVAVSREIIENILKILQKSGTNYIRISKEKYLIKDYNNIYLKKIEHKKNKYLKELPLNKEVQYRNYIFIAEFIDRNDMKYNKNSFYLDFDKLKNINSFIIRARKVGDYFYPLGMNSKKKLKRFFIDEKINKEERDTIPIITNADDIVWVAGYRGSNEFIVEEGTQNILKISFKEVAEFE